MNIEKVAHILITKTFLYLRNRKTPQTKVGDIRTLEWKVKTLGKQLGKAGEKIHQLRTESEYHRVTGQVSPRDHHSALERMRAAEAEVVELRGRIKELENSTRNQVAFPEQ